MEPKVPSDRMGKRDRTGRHSNNTLLTTFTSMVLLKFLGFVSCDSYSHCQLPIKCPKALYHWLSLITIQSNPIHPSIPTYSIEDDLS